MLARFVSLIGALLLIMLAGSALLLFGAGGPAAAAQTATGCPITGLPPTPTSGSPLDASTIKLNELLTAPKKDWNCDGKADAGDQWIELKNTSGKDESLFGLQLASQGQAVLLNSTDRIAANGFLVIFSSQIPTIALEPGSGQLQLLDSAGSIVDAVNYPPLGADQSYSRTAGGQWQTTSTPTPGKANVFTSGTATPTPTATRHPGGGGGGGRGGPTATPTPIGTIFLPTDTPGGGVALQNPAGGTPDSSSASSTQGVPSWLKIALFACIGALLLGVGIWYWRTWDQEPEDDG